MLLNINTHAFSQPGKNVVFIYVTYIMDTFPGVYGLPSHVAKNEGRWRVDRFKLQQVALQCIAAAAKIKPNDRH